ncbi:MAG: FkbM family methyltransferase [Chloroflexia bacterium]|nr:FkbM family methyltransferase [Chloroflexia bacterium]
MNLEAFIVRAERGVMRRLPPGLVFEANARLHRWKGERELRELPRLVAPSTIAVDVGAHFGTYSHALCRLVGQRGRVLSFEPIEEDARYLETAARQLRLPMDVHACALSSVNGTAGITVPDRHGDRKTALASLEPHETGGETRTVEVRRLDDFLAGADKPVSFIKIDVEGHESAVLDGAAATIARHKPNLLIEIEERFHDGPASATFDQVLAMGYRGEFLNATGQRRPISEFDPARHQDPAIDVLSREFIANFIFLPV